MAKSGFTHMAHILTTEREGRALSLMNWPEFVSAAKFKNSRNPPPLTREEFDKLIKAIPDDWIRTINIVNYNEPTSAHNPKTLKNLVNEEKPAVGEWLELENGDIGQLIISQKIINLHKKHQQMEACERKWTKHQSH
jgi:hypothetical protein